MLCDDERLADAIVEYFTNDLHLTPRYRVWRGKTLKQGDIIPRSEILQDVLDIIADEEWKEVHRDD